MMRDKMHKQGSFIMINQNPLESGILKDHVTIKVNLQPLHFFAVVFPPKL